MSFPPPDNNPFSDVETIVTLAYKLGLPHFQRGSVWKESDYARLLESLTLDTPCGAILLWKPIGLTEEFGQFGLKAWEGGVANSIPEYLVLDGQQRITAMHRLFFGYFNNQGSRETNSEFLHWGLNPYGYDRLAEHLTDKDSVLSKQPMFVKLPKEPTPRDGKEPSSFALKIYEKKMSKLIPLKDMLRHPYPDSLWSYSEQDVPKEFLQIVEGVRSIKSRKFQIIVKEQESPKGRYDLREMVQLFNRINSSGVQVRVEEHAFARLVTIFPDANKWIAKVYNKVHQEGVPSKEKQSEVRNTVLQHQRERQFGFSLFIKTFAQAVGYHLEGRFGDFSFLDREELIELYQKQKGTFEAFEENVTGALVKTAEAVRALGCDDFRFIPSIDVLRMPLQLLILFPKADRRLIQSVICLSPFIKDCPGDLSKVVHPDDTLEEALAVLNLSKLPDISELEGSISESRSTTNTLVSLFYWLLKERGAADPEKLKKQNKPDNAPQRQHIIPYARLRRLYGLDYRRPGTHDIHRLANLTFLSTDVNEELGDSMEYLDDMKEKELEAHLLPNDVVRQFNIVREKIKCWESQEEPDPDDALSEDARKEFDEFCRLRGNHIAEAWYDRLQEHVEQLGEGSQQTNLHPQARYFDANIEKMAQELEEYPVIQEAMKRVIQIGHPIKNKGDIFGFWLTSSGSKTTNLRIRIKWNAEWISIGKEAPAAEEVKQAVIRCIGENGIDNEGCVDFYRNSVKDPKAWANALNAVCDSVKAYRQKDRENN